MAFAPFLDKAPYAKEGVYRFRADTSALRAAATSVRLAASTAKDVAPAVRVVLRAGRLKLSSYARGCFAEELMDVSDSNDVPDDGVAFVLDGSTLAGIIRAFPKEAIEVAFDATRQLLTVSEGKAKVELASQPPARMVEYSGRLGLPEYVAPVPTELLRGAIRYAGLLSPEGSRPISHLSVADVTYAVRHAEGLGEVHQGLVVGASDKAVLAFQSPSLRGLNFALNQSLRDFVVKALTRLDPSCTALYRAEGFHMLLDGTRLFGFERPPIGLPPALAEKHLRTRPHDLVRGARVDLRRAIARVAAVSERSSVVQLVVSGAESEAQLTLRMTDPASGRLAEDSLSVVRGQEPGPMFGRPREAVVHLSVLNTLLGHFSGPDVTISFDGRFIRLYDPVANANTTSAITCETPLAQGAQAAA